MKLEWPRKKDADGHDTCCCPECDAEVEETQVHCTVCGYDIVQKARVDLGHAPGAGLA